MTASTSPLTIGVNGQSTKQNEIEFLTAVVAKVGEHSYLSHFFSPPLVSWLSQQIRNDFSCDLWGTYDATCMAERSHREDADRRLAEIETLRGELRDARAMVTTTVEQLKAECDAMQKERDAMTATYKSMQVEIETRDSKLDEIAAMVKEAWFDEEKMDLNAVRQILKG